MQGQVFCFAALLVVGGLSFIEAKPAAPFNKCESIFIEPAYDYENVKNINNLVGPRDTAVRIAGYIQYPAMSQGYMPLEFQTVESTNIGKTHNELTISANCTNMTLFSKLEGGLFKVDKISLVFPFVYPKVYTGYCDIDDPEISFASQEHWKCQKKRSYPCVGWSNIGTKVTLAHLVLYELEFEVNGDPKKISEGKFSTPSHLC